MQQRAKYLRSTYHSRLKKESERYYLVVMAPTSMLGLRSAVIGDHHHLTHHLKELIVDGAGRGDYLEGSSRNHP